MESKTENRTTPLTLDDFTVGQTFKSGSATLDAAQIKAFAKQFDPQPFHLNEDADKSAILGGFAASGWHTAGVTMSLLVASLPIEGGLVGAGADITWTRPTRPGDTLHVVTEVLEINPSRKNPDRGMVTVRSTTLNQDGKTVQILVSRMVVPRRKA